LRYLEELVAITGNCQTACCGGVLGFSEAYIRVRWLCLVEWKGSR
jgi:hypothetical protein